MTFTELLARIGLAFARTSDLVMKGAFNDVVLSDVGIIAAALGLCVCIALALMASIRALLVGIAISEVGAGGSSQKLAIRPAGRARLRRRDR